MARSSQTQYQSHIIPLPFRFAYNVEHLAKDQMVDRKNDLETRRKSPVFGNQLALVMLEVQLQYSSQIRLRWTSTNRTALAHVTQALCSGLRSYSCMAQQDLS